MKTWTIIFIVLGIVIELVGIWERKRMKSPMSVWDHTFPLLCFVLAYLFSGL